MASFDEAIKFVLKNEGGFVDNKSDPGGATNYGISLRFLKSTGDYGDIDGDGDIDVDDIHLLDEESCKKIYKHEFWDRYGFSGINSNKLATKVFDIAINCGPSTAIRIVQKAINSIRQADKDITLISVDGKMGKVTLESINALDSDPLLSAIVFFQKTYYRDLCERNGKLSVFLKGWLKRADNI